MILLLACVTADAPVCQESPHTPLDLDDDGFTDIAWAQTEDATGNYLSTSMVSYGPDFERSTPFETIGADGVAAGDVTGDGFVDLAFASVSDGENRNVDSLVYLGNADGPVTTDPVRLPGLGASAVTLHDVDKDGVLDLFLSNRYNGDGVNLEAYSVDSVLYTQGLSVSVPIPTVGAADARFADFDNDGNDDLVVASGTFFSDVSTVYYGPDFGRTVDLATSAPEGVEVADWNHDGWVDIAFANFYDALDLDIDSVVYWGSEAGFETSDTIATHGATDMLAVDRTGDGCPELVVANSMTGTFAELNFEVESAVWAWDGAWTQTEAFATVSAAAVSVVDDALVFANRYDAEGEPATESYMYGEELVRVPTVGAAGVTGVTR